ncbi:MAG: P1 family peptidase [Clostridia bacterium]
MNIIIPKGFKIGHAGNEFSGVTVILSEKGAVGGCDQRGGAPGTRETDLFRNEKMVQKMNAVVLSGGSAYGLAASTGVMDYCRDNGIGLRTAGKIVPIVAQAVIFDLNQKEYHCPDAKLGLDACLNTKNSLTFGQVGAGIGATVGKIRGVKNSSKSGIGAATVKIAGVNVTAIVVVNAMGDVVNPETNQIIAGAKNSDGSFLDTNKCLKDGSFMKLMMGSNTTIGCILTDANISKVEANKLATISHNGLARTIRPVHTDFDGDTMFCLSSGHRPVLNFMLLQVAAVEATEKAILNAVSSGVGYTVLSDDADDGWQCE